MCSGLADKASGQLSLTLIVNRRLPDLRPALPEIDTFLILAACIQPARAMRVEVSLLAVTIREVTKDRKVVQILFVELDQNFF